MLNKLKKQTKGFTIIEVLIVLAIAGLILLIVFLAVPALQRNSRNTQRRNDVAAILGGVNEFSNNNSGKLPVGDAQFSTDVDNLIKDGFYVDGDTVWADAAPAADPTMTVDKVNIYGASKCSSQAVVAGPARQYVARFAVEGSGGTPIQQCQEG